MKVYVDLSAFCMRHDHVRGLLWFYIFELKDWVEWAHIYEDAGGKYVLVYA